MDYRELNRVTIKNKYRLPRIDDLFDQLQGFWLYSKIDFQSNYINYDQTEGCAQGNVTRYSHYKFTIMPFRLTNALAAFMN